MEKEVLCDHHRQLIMALVSYLRSCKSQSKYAEVLMLKLWPVLHLISADQMASWKKDLAKYHDEFTIQNSRGLEELKATSLELIAQIEAQDLLGNEGINDAVNRLKRCIHGEERQVFPSLGDMIYEKFKNVCNQLLDLGYVDLIMPYAEVIFREEYVEDDQVIANQCFDCKIQFKSIPVGVVNCPRCCGDIFPIRRRALKVKPRIAQFTLAPNYFNALSTQDLLSNGFTNEPRKHIAAYELLRRFKWAWNLSRDYFRKKKLCYKSQANCNKAARYLNEHVLLEETNAVGKDDSDKVILFKRNRLDKNLELLLHAIDPLLIDISPNPTPHVIIHALELCLEDDVKLRLKVYWTPDIVETLELARFNEAENGGGKVIESATFNLVNQLLNAPGKSIKVGSVSGANAKKFLNRMQIKGILFELFIQNHTSTSATLTATKITLKKESQIHRAIFNYIKKLSTVSW